MLGNVENVDRVVGFVGVTLGVILGLFGGYIGKMEKNMEMQNSKRNMSTT